MRQHYDAIVLGVGGVGSSALSHLAQRGLRVLGLDRFPPGHDRGSSHGQTRLIRQAYYEHPDYVPLLKRAYSLWAELSARCGKQLYHEVGVLQVGLPAGRVIPGILASSQQHQLEVEKLSSSEVSRRFPGFECPETLSAVFERRAGYLRVEDCVTAYASEAQQLGAELRIGESILNWSATSQGVEVQTDQGTYGAGHLIITAGAWASQFLKDIGIDFVVTRKPLYWFETPGTAYRADQGAPGFIYETPLGNFYGFPVIDGNGLKVAEHSGGDIVSDPLTVNREEQPAETVRVSQFLSEYLPQVTTKKTNFDVCLYTLSPDRNFVVDRHPTFPHVSFAAGLSGHGFKFASVLGETLVDLATTGQTKVPAEFLSCRRLLK